MKNSFLFTSLISLLLLASSFKPKQTLSVTVTNLKRPNAKVMLALYEKGRSFPDANSAYKSLTISPSNNKAIGTFDVTYGEYAIAVFQDVNDNGKLDAGWFGIPKEPYGFSNNFRPVFSAPKFNDCKIDFSETNFQFQIKLN